MKISLGNSRMDKKWKNAEMTWEELKNRMRTTKITSETVDEFTKLPKGQQDTIKDVGGFVGGHIKDGRRKKGNILCRSLLALDMDYATSGIWEEITLFQDFQCCIYSTHKHTPDNPRLRLLIPLSREISEEEYGAVGRMVAQDIGIDLFDDTTYEAARLMYWPSTSSDGEFLFEEIDGYLLDPDKILALYTDWKDVSTWPVSSRQSKIIQNDVKKQIDPLTKEGVVGIFCRTFSVQEAMDAFLGDVYSPSAMEGRYDYDLADSSAGVVVYEDKFIYSHHASDPANGQLLNAFDVVRVHKFDPDDEKKSFHEMCDFAMSIDAVKQATIEEKRTLAAMDFSVGEDWQTKLRYMKKGNALENSVWNLMLILNNDPAFQNIAFNELVGRVEVTGEVPWTRPTDNRFWRDADTAQMKAHIDIHYATFSSRNHDVAFTKMVEDRRFHPLREWLDSLPEWDGVTRLENLYIDFLGANNTSYVKAATRKSFVAAVARIYEPGIKFDSVTVLVGPQGCGKSTIFAKMGGIYYSDSLCLTDMKDKASAEKLQGYWLLELGELAGLKKTDIEVVKAFLSRTDDIYRPSYGRTVESHPRQCILVGTTNSETGFLRDITGNRRFWPVKVMGDSPRKSLGYHRA
ncbi:MAG: virulence-associated E family protein [Eubacteriales bacterium]